ncbi:hypothetical protein DSECCO2_468940 [anaerobic digester metagenome]
MDPPDLRDDAEDLDTLADALLQARHVTGRLPIQRVLEEFGVEVRDVLGVPDIVRQDVQVEVRLPVGGLEIPMNPGDLLLRLLSPGDIPDNAATVERPSVRIADDREVVFKPAVFAVLCPEPVHEKSLARCDCVAELRSDRRPVIGMDAIHDLCDIHRSHLLCRKAEDLLDDRAHVVVPVGLQVAPVSRVERVLKNRPEPFLALPQGVLCKLPLRDVGEERCGVSRPGREGGDFMPLLKRGHPVLERHRPAGQRHISVGGNEIGDLHRVKGFSYPPVQDDLARSPGKRFKCPVNL